MYGNAVITRQNGTRQLRVRKILLSLSQLSSLTILCSSESPLCFTGSNSLWTVVLLTFRIGSSAMTLLMVGLSDGILAEGLMHETFNLRVVGSIP